MDVFLNWLFGFSRIALLGILLAVGLDLTSRFAMEENNINWSTFFTVGFTCLTIWLMISGLIYYISLMKNGIVTFEQNDTRTISYNPSKARSNFISNIKYFLIINIAITLFFVSIFYAEKSVSFGIIRTVIDWLVS